MLVIMNGALDTNGLTIDDGLAANFGSDCSSSPQSLE